MTKSIDLDLNKVENETKKPYATFEYDLIDAGFDDNVNVYAKHYYKQMFSRIIIDGEEKDIDRFISKYNLKAYQK